MMGKGHSQETLGKSSPTIDDVYGYWNEAPLLSHELDSHGTHEFWDQFDKIKRKDSDRFALPYWAFDQFKNQKVLDVGCGPGWISVQYAIGGANVYAIDLTDKAVDLTKAHLEHYGLKATVKVGNAEDIPFGDNMFDAIVSSGVLHHTPDTQKAIEECFRVLKPGGVGKITLYRKGLLHSWFVFPFTRFIMTLTRMKHPGSDLAKDASSVDDFIRQYDGAANPVGIGKWDKEWEQDLKKAGFECLGYEVHFFPKRFLPFGNLIPRAVHKFFDKYMGTMVYFNLRKPVL